MEEQVDIEMSMKFLYLSTENNTPLNFHEIPEWPLQTPTWMRIFHPQNWLRQEDQSSTSSHNSQMTIYQMIKIHSLGLFLYFINILILLMFPIHPQTQSNSNLGVGPRFAMCPPFPSLPSSPILSRTPLGFSNSHEISLGCYIST